MDQFGEDLFAPQSLGEYRARHNANHTNNPYSDVREQDITTQNSLTPQHIDHQSPYQPSYLPRQSPYDPLVPSSGSVPREDNGSFPVVSKKRIRTDAESEDDPEEPPRKSRRSIRRPMHPSKRQTQADAAIENGSEGDENQSAPRKPTERKRFRRSKADIYKNHDDEGENEQEKEKRERKVSKFNQKIAEGKGPERGLLGPKGAVRIRDGQMEFKDLNNPKWTLAAYHCEFRRHFLDEAAEAGGFDHEPACGEADDDETSFEPEQQSWGPSRTDWHNIVNSGGDKVMFQVEKSANRRPPQEPGNWIHDGYVLLDSKNHPVKDWPGLNKTLSSEVEGWRWEAIMRLYPWLTVADLMARMPHTREKNGQVLPLQTSQAFTNRALRLRIPNQMPTAKPKNGSAAYKKEILKNLAKKNAQTTEDLPTLSQPQIAKARSANKGNFAGNSRYVVKKDDGSTGMPPPSSKKRKINRDDATEPEEYLEAPEAKKQRTQPPYQTGVEMASGAVGDDVDADADTDWEGADLYNAPPNSAALVNDQSQLLGPAQATGQFQDHYENGLVLLFSTIVDREYALAVDKTFTTAAAVKRAKEDGFQLEWINVEWYRPNVPRYVNPDGSVVESVVHMDAFDQLVFPGGFNDDSQGAFEGSGAYNAPPSFAQDEDAFQGSGTYNATSSFAQDDGAFNDDSQGTLHGVGAHNATPLFAQDDGSYDAASTFPYGDVASDFNTFYDQHDFGGNPNPLPQIPTTPLPTLQTQQSEGYETQPDIFDEIWQSLNSR